MNRNLTCPDWCMALVSLGLLLLTYSFNFGSRISILLSHVLLQIWAMTIVSILALSRPRGSSLCCQHTLIIVITDTAIYLPDLSPIIFHFFTSPDCSGGDSGYSSLSSKILSAEYFQPFTEPQNPRTAEVGRDLWRSSGDLHHYWWRYGDMVHPPAQSRVN